MPVIDVANVSKNYPARPGGRVLVGRGGLGDWLRGRRDSAVAALEDITLQVESGESIGIIGANGSGKSTLLKIIAGVTVPTAGSVSVYGRVASLLELGAGFHPMLTGRENVYLNAGILGMRHAQVNAIFDEIVTFSGIGNYIDNPVDTYSSGMYVRIAFAVAAYTNPDIFLIDEVLSVGDEEFQRRCRARIGELREQGKTIVFVSHDLSIVNSLCRRVVLMSKGRMILRDSPRKAIDFYLAQVGAEKGVHTLTDGPVEAVFSNGRVSAFHCKEEWTGASGFHFRLRHLGRWHESAEAEWSFAEKDPHYCAAVGSLSRLPVRIEWKLRIENGVLSMDVALDVAGDAAIEEFELKCLFHPGYTQWFYDDDQGPFPEILPQDVDGAAVIATESLCESAGLLPREGSPLPPVAIRVDAKRAHLRGYWANTDYLTGARVFQASGPLALDGETLSKGHHPLVSLQISPGIRPETATATIRRTIVSGPLTFRFERGRVRITRDGDEVTAFLHLYASMLIGGLWNDSHHLRWDDSDRDGETLIFTGQSRRFPYRLEWRMTPVENGVDLEIWLHVLEPLDVQEHHTTVVLNPAYSQFRTAHEGKPFPDFDPGFNDWRHVNESYDVSAFIEASGPTLPTIHLEADPERLPHRMTAINTGYQHPARVLQALHAPGAGGSLHFEPGRHLYFAGRIHCIEAIESRVERQ